MHVVRTYEDFKKVLPSDKTIAAFSIEKSPIVVINNIIRHEQVTIHPGYAKLIEEANRIADISLMTTFDWDVWIRGSNVQKEPWLEDAFISFCELHNLDILWIIDSKEDIISNKYLNEIKNIISTEYPDIKNDVRTPTEIAFISYLHSPIKRDYHVMSWKDGYWRWIWKDFLERYCNVEVLMIDPVEDKNGLPYSASFIVHSKYVLDTLAEANSMMHKYEYLIPKYITEYENKVLSEINSIKNVSAKMKIYSGLIYEGHSIEVKVLVEEKGVLKSAPLIIHNKRLKEMYL